MRITVAAAGPAPVVLDGLRPVRIDRRPPAGEPLAPFGRVEVRQFELDLDREPPLLRRPAGGTDFPVTVAPGASRYLELVVRSTVHDVRWFLELDTVQSGRRRTIRVDLAGEPFRTRARDCG